MELNRSQGRGGGAESRDKGTKEEIQMKGSNGEEREETLEDRYVERKRDEVGIGKGHHQGRREGKKRGRKEERGKGEGRSQHARAPPASEEEVAGPACQTGCSLFGPSFCSQCYWALQGRQAVPWDLLEPTGAHRRVGEVRCHQVLS